jgi:hypothetical protein
MVTFYFVNKNVIEAGLYKEFILNYNKGGCGTLEDFTNSLQNAGLLACGYMTFGVFAFLFFVH